MAFSPPGGGQSEAQVEALIAEHAWKIVETSGGDKSYEPSSSAQTATPWTSLPDNLLALMLIGRWRGQQSTGGVTLSLALNGSEIASNRQLADADGTGWNALARDTNSYMQQISSTPGETSMINLLIPCTKTGEARHSTQIGARAEGSSGIRLRMIASHITTPSEATAYSSVGLVSSKADGIGVGTCLTLLALTGDS